MTECTGVSDIPSPIATHTSQARADCACTRLPGLRNLLTNSPSPIAAAVIFLTALDGLFVVISISWDFLQDPTCVCNNTCPESPKMLEVFEIVSLVITSLFVLEIPLSLYSLGLNHYTTAEHAYLHAFDAAVIVTTFALEVFLRVSTFAPLVPPHTADPASRCLRRVVTPKSPRSSSSPVYGASPSLFRQLQ